MTNFKTLGILYSKGLDPVENKSEADTVLVMDFLKTSTYTYPKEYFTDSDLPDKIQKNKPKLVSSLIELGYIHEEG